eukprot:1468867-Heterocapsa_arctica.AAC.1
MVEGLDAVHAGEVGLPAGTGWRLSSSLPWLWWKPVACPVDCDCCFGEKRRRIEASSAEEEGDVTPVEAPDDLPVLMSSGASGDSDIEA